jgi:glutamyl-tRNA reductase
VTEAKEAQQKLREQIKVFNEWMGSIKARPRISKLQQAQLTAKEAECSTLHDLLQANEELVQRLAFWPAKFYDVGMCPPHVH